MHGMHRRTLSTRRDDLAARCSEAEALLLPVQGHALGARGRQQARVEHLERCHPARAARYPDAARAAD